MAAALVLFFVCVPKAVNKLEVASLLAAAARGEHWHSPSMQYALKVRCGLTYNRVCFVHHVLVVWVWASLWLF